MISFNVLALTYKNLLYILIKSNNNQKLLLNLKKLEYKINKFYYNLLIKNNKLYLFYNFIYIFKIGFTFINKSLEIKYYIFNKYHFNNFFEKSFFYVYLDRFIYSNYIYNLINI
jgi:hypothetical protein